MTCFVYIDSDAAVTMLDEVADDVWAPKMAEQRDDSMPLPSEGDLADSGNTSNLSISINIRLISNVYDYKILMLKTIDLLS